MKNRIIQWIAVLLLGIPPAGKCQYFSDKIPEIDRYIDSVMRQWRIPGLSLSIVYKNQIVLEKGYGYRDLDQRLTADSNTLFPIGSNTKLFTSTLACMLAADSLLDLDQPVRNYLPELVFYNSELNGSVTLRDMLNHRTGLPRYDWAWVGTDQTSSELIARVRYMKPVLGFREGYLYNNMMYIASAAAMEKVANVSWNKMIRDKLLTPLDMGQTCIGPEEAAHYGNYARTYFISDSTGLLKKTEYFIECPGLAPAGSIRSSAAGMSHWMIALLNCGRWRSHAVIPEKAIEMSYQPGNIVTGIPAYPELSPAVYCFGRILSSYKGHLVAYHGGAIDGYFSSVTLFNRDSIGIFIAVNADHGRSVASFVPWAVFDRLMGLEKTPWSERYFQNWQNDRQNQKTNDSLADIHVMHTSPSHALADYSGTYRSEISGDMQIECTGGQLWLRYKKLCLPLDHFHYDQFYSRKFDDNKPRLMIQFITGAGGKIQRLNILPDDGGSPANLFTRQK